MSIIIMIGTLCSGTLLAFDFSAESVVPTNRHRLLDYDVIVVNYSLNGEHGDEIIIIIVTYQ